MGEKRRSAHIIVVGNEKGGSGKTTVAIHIAIALLRQGYGVATLDLDPRQRSLTRYIGNRCNWCADHGHDLPIPDHRLVERSGTDSHDSASQEERQILTAALAELRPEHDYIVIDCPGADTPLSRFAHGFADSLLTPINDSFIDLDLLLQFRPGGFEVQGFGVYLQMLWELRLDRRRWQQPDPNWIILRNRLSPLGDRNRRDLHDVLEKLGPVLGFRMGGGIGERVIFRQLFLQGLTVLDVGERGVDIRPTKSHTAARDEIIAILSTLGVPPTTPGTPTPGK